MNKNNSLLNSAAFAQAALDSVSANVCIIDKAGIILAVNQRWRDFFHTNSSGTESSIGLNYLDICSTASGSRSEEALPMYEGIMSVIHGQAEEFTLEYPCHSPTELRWFRARVTRFRDGSGNIVIAHELITEQKLAENKLKMSELKFRAIFDNAPLGIAIVEVNTGNIVLVNPTFCNLLGYTEEEFLKKNLVDISYPTDLEVNVALTAKLREGEINSFSMEKRYFKKDKSTIWTNLTVAGLKMDRETVEHFIGIVSDITEIRNNSEKLKENAQNLEALNATKDKFFNIIAHDLRNPFAGILGVNDILREKVKGLEDIKSKELLKLSDMIQTSAKSAFALLENLMQWARSQTGDISFEPMITSIDAIIEATIPLVSGNAFEKNISIHLDLPAGKFIFADPILTNTILRNLLTNAIKFTFPGGKVTVSTKVSDDFAEISVIDTGIGMKADNIDKLFRIDSKFTKLGTANERGTGLGLILCKELTEIQGGTIRVESNFGEGSNFTFTLPLVK